MKRTMPATIRGAALIGIMVSSGMLSAAQADTWVFRDSLRPNGHDRSMAVRRADGRKCGASNDRSFADAIAQSLQQCMLARGWALDHIIPDPPSAHARRQDNYQSPPVDTSAPSNNDDFARVQQQNDTQQMLNDQQRANDEMQQQQQQQIINDMNR